MGGAGHPRRADRKGVLDTFQVTAAVFDRRPQHVSEAQLASVRRALRNLEKQGKVFGAAAFGRKHRLWSHLAGFGAIPSEVTVDVEKLVKVLGMLGSTHPGEVAAAGTAAHKLITEAGLGWQDLIMGARR